MRITQAEAWLVTMRLEEPYSVAYRYSDSTTNVFFRLETDQGVFGLGCVAPDPEVTGETAEQTLQTLQGVVLPLVKGEDPLRITKLLEAAKPHLLGAPAALGALDLALHDLIGKVAGLPLWRLLGGYRESIATSMTIGILPEAETVERALHWIERGFRILKIKGGHDWEIDIARIRRVREAVGNEITIRFDANQGYTPEAALKFAWAASAARVELMEQPVAKHKVEELALVNSRSPLPIMADESLTTLSQAKELALHRSVSLFNIKLTKVGGIHEAMKMLSLADSSKIGIMIGCMDEASAGISAGLHLALARPEVTLADLDGHIGLEGDPTAGSVRVENGFLFPSHEPGLGCGGIR